MKIIYDITGDERGGLAANQNPHGVKRKPQLSFKSAIVCEAFEHRARELISVEAQDLVIVEIVIPAAA